MMLINEKQNIRHVKSTAPKMCNRKRKQ